MSAALDQKERCSPIRKTAQWSAWRAAHESLKKGPLIPHAAGMETRSESEHRPASWVPFRHLQAIGGLLSSLVLLTTGSVLRKAHFFCDHRSV